MGASTRMAIRLSTLQSLAVLAAMSSSTTQRFLQPSLRTQRFSSLQQLRIVLTFQTLRSKNLRLRCRCAPFIIIVLSAGLLLPPTRQSTDGHRTRTPFFGRALSYHSQLYQMTPLGTFSSTSIWAWLVRKLCITCINACRMMLTFGWKQ